MGLKLKAIKNLWSGAKQLKTSIKSYRAARSPQTLALKRLEAKNYVATIPDKTWDKISKSVFEQKGDSRSRLLDKLQNYKRFCDENGIKMPEDVLEAYNKLEHKATVFADRMALAKSKGKTPQNTWTYGEKFQANNKKELDKLQSFITEQQNNAMARWHKEAFSETFDPIAVKQAEETFKKIEQNSLDLDTIKHAELYNTKIGEVSPEIIYKGQTFYHGTTHQRAIKKNGFHLIPKKGQATFGARELGEGVYLTPDKKVASYYAGLRGGILPTKVDIKKVAAVNNNQIGNATEAIARNLDHERIQNPAVRELVLKRLFERNGYNAAYSREALGSGLFAQKKIVDALAGGKQSQLTVFDTGDITIIDKTLKDRLVNQILQIGTALRAPIRLFNS